MRLGHGTRVGSRGRRSPLPRTLRSVRRRSYDIVQYEMGLIASTLERGAHLVSRYLEPTLRELGITGAEAHVLAQVGKNRSTPIASLHHEFGHKRSTLTNVVDRLEHRGFVRREGNPRDRRSVVVHLTASGRPLARRVIRALATLDGELAALVEPRDLAGVGAVGTSLR